MSSGKDFKKKNENNISASELENVAGGFLENEREYSKKVKNLISGVYKSKGILDKKRNLKAMCGFIAISDYAEKYGPLPK